MIDRVQETEKELAKQSTALIISATSPAQIVGSLMSLVSGRNRSAAKRKLLDAVLEESKRVQKELMERGAEAADLQIGSEKEAFIAERRIQHAHNMDELNVSATCLQNRVVIGMFEDKKLQLETLAKVDGDPKLKEVAAQLFARMAEQNAMNLVKKNQKPKPR